MSHKNDKILSLIVNWNTEDYLYEHGINLEELGPSYYKIFKNEKLLEQPKHIYKYYNDSHNSLNSLLEGYFYFSEPKKLNDPFECLNNREENIIKRAKDKESIIKHRENIGICSFSLTNESPLMWGHYTNNYHGFCLKFNNEKIKANENLPMKSHVSYLKKYEPGNNSLREAKDEIRNFPIDQFLKNIYINHVTVLFEYCWKQYEWNYEQEYRFLSLSSNSFERKYKYDKICLEEIYIDYRMKTQNKNIYNLLMFILKNNYSHIKAYEVKPHQLLAKLEFIPIGIKLEN